MGTVHRLPSGQEPSAAEIENALTETDVEFEERMMGREKALERCDRENRIAAKEASREVMTFLHRDTARTFRPLGGLFRR